MFDSPASQRPKLKLQSCILLGLAVMLHIAAALIVTQLGHPSVPIRPPQVLQMAWFGQEKKSQAPQPASPPTPAHPHRKIAHPVRVVHHQPAPSPKPALPPPVLTAETTAQAAPKAEDIQATATQEANKSAHAANPAADTGQQGQHAPQTTATAGPTFRPDYLNNPSPEYPRLSRELHEEGRVMLRVLISPDGHAKDIALKKSSGFARLDTSAMDAVRDWRFLPAHQGDTPVASWVVIPIDFKLRNTES